MTDAIEFYYDFGSPNAYLVHQLLPAIAKKHDVSLKYCPILLGGVFKATNNKAPMMAFSEISGKVTYSRTEFARFVERHALPFTWNPHFPVNTLALMRSAVFAQGQTWEAMFINAAFDAMWRDGADMSDVNSFEAALENRDVPLKQIAEAIQSQRVKDDLARVTAAAVERGVFGAPTVFWKDEMFFGKDALGDLEWRLGQV